MIFTGFKFFLIKNKEIIEIEIYAAETKEICSIEKPLSIKMPNIAVPKAVAKTIKAVVRALIEPMYLTPYISAQVDDPRTLQRPFVIPINPKNTNDEIGLSK